MSKLSKRKAEVRRNLNSLIVEFMQKRSEYFAFINPAVDEISELNRKIIKTFIASCVKNSNVVVTNEEVRQIYDVNRMESLQSYSPYNPFIALKIYGRSKRKLNAKNNEYHLFFRELLKRIKLIHIEMDELGFRSYTQLIELREATVIIIKQRIDTDSYSMGLIESVFTDGWKMDKHSFLQIITVQKGKHHWDGTKVTPYLELIKDIPDEIDFETFKDLIFMEKIEHYQDCYLFDIFMKHMLDVMDQYKKETGIGAFDIFQEIAEKPLQTFTAHRDDYGDIVSMEPNKPNLKIINGGS